MKIRVNSITYAMKSKEVLQSVGIDAVVVKDLRPRGGCVYAISFPDKYVKEVAGILKEHGIILHASEDWKDYQ